MLTVKPNLLENHGRQRKERQVVKEKRCLSRHGTLVGYIGSEIVRVVYSDETENGPIAVIAALVLNMDEHWSNIESELAKIKDETPKLLLYQGKELKGGNLYSAVRKIEQLRSKGKPIEPDLQKAVDILVRILAVLIKYPTPIFYGAVDKDGYDKYLQATPPRGGFLRPRIGVTSPVTLNRTKIKTTAHDIAFDASSACGRRCSEFSSEERTGVVDSGSQRRIPPRAADKRRIAVDQPSQGTRL